MKKETMIELNSLQRKQLKEIQLELLDEFIILKNNELAYLSKNAEEIERNFNNLVNDVTMNINPFIKNQYDYASKNLNFENTYLFLEKEIKML